MTATRPDLLAGLAEAEAASVLALGTHSLLPAGAVLFNLGDAADSLFVVERGRLALTLPMQVRGKQQDVLIEERSAGQTLGWSALVPPHHFTLKAAALVDSAVVALPRERALRAPGRAPGGRLPGGPQRERGRRAAAAGVPDHVAARDAARGRAQPGLQPMTRLALPGLLLVAITALALDDAPKSAPTPPPPAGPGAGQEHPRSRRRRSRTASSPAPRATPT